MSQRKYPYTSGAYFGTLISGLVVLATLAASSLTAVAGDLLRGGYSGARGGAGSALTFTPPNVVQERKNAQDMLARTTSAISAARSLQAGARAVAVANGGGILTNPFNHAKPLPVVPNGLSAGGLVPSNVSSWVGVAGAPSSSVANGKTTVTVVQTAQDAFLTWSSFNIGSKTTLDFNQGKGGSNVNNWIAFNIISDPSLAPSQILGSIVAPGQVYVINQNGIIFGGASQVNVHTLVASSLQLNSSLAHNGLLNNSSSQFLFSALATPPGVNGTPNGDVFVEPGAELTAPTTPDHVGGRIALIGPNVTNDGNISTPDGQTILAAGLQVGIGASADPTLRGLNIYVGAISSPNYPAMATAGAATNDGYISVPRGDVTIAGANVLQNGVIDSTTSVSLNGRIDLLADYGAVAQTAVLPGKTIPPFNYTKTGTVTLADGSVSQIVPELSDPTTVVGQKLALLSTIQIDGQAIHFAGDATVYAPNANATINAGIFGPVNPNTGLNSIQFFNTAMSSPQVYFDSGAALDVAGSTDVSASVLENIIQVQLRGNELANDPLQRFGVFRGQTINIDVRQQGTYNGVPFVGTPLADASGYVGLVQRTVGELTIGGGNVNINAGGSVVLQHGSQINTSGGFIDYQGGIVDTTQVLVSGHLLDISQATPNLIYQGIYTGQFTVTAPKYGLSSTYTDPILGGGHYEDGYIYGGNGGSISIVSPEQALDGALLGQTVAGPRQVGSTSVGPRLQPQPSSLSLSFSSQDVTTTPLNPITQFAAGVSVTFASAAQTPVGAFGQALTSERATQVFLSPDLISTDGFSIFNLVDSDGNVVVPSSTTLTAQGTAYTNPSTATGAPATAGNSITLTGANITVDGAITLPGGQVSLTSYNISPYAVAVNNTKETGSQTVFTPVPGRGLVQLGSSGSISTAGSTVDDRITSSNAQLAPDTIAAGAVTIAGYNVDLETGSVIDVSGGVEMSAAGKATYGNAGGISITAGRDPNVGYLIGGKLVLDSVLSGYAGLGSNGGRLSITAPLIRIGAPAAGATSFVINPDFFDQGGFTSFSLSGQGASTAVAGVDLPGLLIGPGVVIDPVAENYLVESAAIAGSHLNLQSVLLPEESRTPVSLAFSATGLNSNTGSFVARGDLVLSPGAIVESAPGGSSAASISFNGTTVEIAGSVIAPGGNISVTGASNSNSIFGNAGGQDALATVDLAPGSLLSTAGIYVPTDNAFGYRTGYVLNGGSISISGNLVAERGAKLDVSGTKAVLDLSPAFTDLSSPQIGSLNGALRVPTVVESNGGSITLQGAQVLVVDATLEGSAGGSAAQGGSLTVSSSVFVPDGQTLPAPSTPNLLITQSGAASPVPLYANGETAIGHAVGVNGKAVSGMGYFAISTFENSGMDSLALNGSVEFQGAVAIHANNSLSVGTGAAGGFILADSTVDLFAPYVALGRTFQGPLTVDQVTAQGNGFGPYGGLPAFDINPTSGNGTLNVFAKLVDVGNLSLQGIKAANFIVSNGDIRGDGTLDIAGKLFMEAAQIYPATADIFNIIAYNNTIDNSAGSVTFAASGQDSLPFSAGGVLNVYASVINQAGVLRAPYGQINLGWDGTGTSPLDPLTGAGYAGAKAAIPIAQNINLSGGSITSVSGFDPVSGAPLVIPYGTNQNGITWLDPSGTDITSVGPPVKSVAISGNSVNEKAGATVDIRGGGDLLSYRFVSGVSGKNDFLNQPGTYAIIPGYEANEAPVGYTGYSSSYLAAHVGEQVYLSSSPGVSAGYYTLLPAQYALLPGAYLVTPQASSVLPVGSTVEPDGSSLVSGYFINKLDNAQTGQPLAVAFDVANRLVLNNRAEYDTFTANTFIQMGAQNANQPVPPLPRDGGHLVLSAVQALTVAGSLEASAAPYGHGALVDITTSNPKGIFIAGASERGQAAAGQLVLDVSKLNSFGAGSLLIGGMRTVNAGDTSIDVTATGVELDNSGTPLTGSDIILAATGTVKVDSGSEILANSSAPGVGTISVTGNGALVRVAGNADDAVERSGVTPGSGASLEIGAKAKLTGGIVTLDSAQNTTLDPSAVITTKDLAVNSGQISLALGGATAPQGGLVLTQATLGALSKTASAFSLLSYTSLDLYGSGQIGATSSSGAPLLQSLALHAGAINGFGGGAVAFDASHILIDDQPQSSYTASTTSNAGGSLTFTGNEIDLGSGQTSFSDFGAGIIFNASSGIMGKTTVTIPAATTGEVPTLVAGGFVASGNVTLNAPLLTVSKGQVESITSTLGSLTLASPAGAVSANLIKGGVGGTLNLTAATISDDSSVAAKAGTVALHSTGAGGMQIGTHSAATIDASGASQMFYDVTKYSDAGQVSLTADAGDVTLGAGAGVDVSAATSGNANGGTLKVTSINGNFNIDPSAKLSASGGAAKGNAGQGGSFILDVGSLASTKVTNDVLNAAGFSTSRTFRVRNGDVLIDGAVFNPGDEPASASFQLEADNGAITVTGAGSINANGATGGTVALLASGNLTLDNGALISVVGGGFNTAGQGGSVDLETTNGTLNLAAGSTIDLSVTALPSGAGAVQEVAGTLHLRALQGQLGATQIGSVIKNASSIVAEGYYAIDTGGDANIDDYKAQLQSNAKAFMSNSAPAIQTSLDQQIAANNPGFSNATLQVRPGEELDSEGTLTLQNDWDLSTLRYGPTGTLSNGVTNVGTVPGMLTLRAAGSINFLGALTDGFGTGAPKSPQLGYWQETLLPTFANGQSQLSWSYKITAGADLTAANPLQVLPLQTLQQNTSDPYYGSVAVGDPSGGDNQGPLPAAIQGYYQVIRTGAGSIDVSAGRDVQLLNQFATIYTAGTRPSSAMGGSDLNGTFDIPAVYSDNKGVRLSTAEYSTGGGNVNIAAQQDIIHLTDGTLPDGSTGLVDDTVYETPNNWLYRRGYIDSTGNFGPDTVVAKTFDSTTWWVDFSNFFEGVGALGGGGVTLNAGNDVKNVDAVVPTNARAPRGVPDASKLVELGGGDLIVKAGHDINGGIYYDERGTATLTAGNQVTTNALRSPTTTLFDGSPVDDPNTYLPTTLYGGDTQFNISARGSVLLGPVVNPFWLPSGIGNGTYLRTYFSTLSERSSVNVTSASGSVTLRDQSYSATESALTPILEDWYDYVLGGASSVGTTVATYQPWLQINETQPTTTFADVYNVMPSTFNVTAYSGGINVSGQINLTPSPTGNLDLLAAGAVNALLPVGANSASTGLSYAASQINLSDADPASLPGITTPDDFRTLVPGGKPTNGTPSTLLDPVNIHFDESGSTAGQFGVIQTKQALHDPALLHAGDTQLVHIYATDGAISGLTLFTPKATRVAAATDVSDIAFYIQNLVSTDVSLVTAGRDILPYDTQSALRIQANAPGNQVVDTYTNGLPGDLQINGPGTLEALAGRNITTGVPDSVTQSSFAAGTGLGIVSIGQARNPALPFDGAAITVAAGLGTVAADSTQTGLPGSSLDFMSFISQFVTGAAGARYFQELGVTDPTLGVSSVADFNKLASDPEQQANVALQIFYLVLRDTGRDHNTVGSPGFGNYTAGTAAIAALFPGSGAAQGSIDLTSREIKTTSGGGINILAPVGQLTVGIDLGGKQPVDQGILTEDGGNIFIYTQGNVNVGTSRIFTLRGGDEMIYSSAGNIAAGASAKTVQSAPPTRVLIDPQSADVKTDLAGLATGGGIGVLATVVGVPPGSVDLIAPTGVIDAGDAGIRATGNLNLAAVTVLNASNIQAGGASSGVPTVTVAAPNIAGISAASSVAGASSATANEQTNSQRPADTGNSDAPSEVDVTVLVPVESVSDGSQG